ncbi:MAG: methyltransferase domain-containing protein [Melioribacteraceae bacterium]
MPVKTYSAIAEIYTHMMRSIDYKEWADYIHQISKEIKKKKISVLELAGGTGAISKILQKKMNIVSTDLSLNMLKQNGDKSFPKVCCDMTCLPFKNKYDFIFSTFDSVNYLNTKEKFIRYLENASRCIDDGGLLAFDVSLENNSKKFEKYLNRRGKVNGITFRQRSLYNPATRIHYNHFELTLANGQKVEEIHKQKIYRFEEYFDFIDKSDFYVHKCYKAFTFKNADAETERAQFILKKKNVC